MGDELHSCYACQFLIRETESWEMPHIWWWECRERPAMANLKSFPFQKTKCKTWELARRVNRSIFDLREGIRE
jgi:hypothetical protein